MQRPCFSDGCSKAVSATGHAFFPLWAQADQNPQLFIFLLSCTFVNARTQVVSSGFRECFMRKSEIWWCIVQYWKTTKEKKQKDNQGETQRIWSDCGHQGNWVGAESKSFCQSRWRHCAVSGWQLGIAGGILLAPQENVKLNWTRQNRKFCPIQGQNVPSVPKIAEMDWCSISSGADDLT